ncbi:unnamed protein product [Notodromas monacha]|uniref:Thymidine kinase n=1 Tax=Notodromas monacha TaxID=399045 RepID=A0A7R9GFH8_9CRUS|nr:unnamed protein product [Notodromas monacha]CAG0918865.1 unnamed protein product [Notodromas monacha]
MSPINELLMENRDRAVVPLRGEIQVILGPMFSGKSTELVRRMKRFGVARHDCLVVKYAKDCRYDVENLATHDKQILPAVAANVLADVRHKAEGVSVIGIDEGQFFPDLKEFCEDMANERKIVIVAALDGTFQRQPFANVMNLIPLAEKVEKLTAVCMMCHDREASFTKRRGSETEVEVIGGEEMYLAVCRSCYGMDSCSPLKTPKRVPFTPLFPSKKRKSTSPDDSKREAATNLNFDEDPGTANVVLHDVAQE